MANSSRILQSSKLTNSLIKSGQNDPIPLARYILTHMQHIFFLHINSILLPICLLSSAADLLYIQIFFVHNYYKGRPFNLAGREVVFICIEQYLLFPQYSTFLCNQEQNIQCINGNGLTPPIRKMKALFKSTYYISAAEDLENNQAITKKIPINEGI